MKKTLFHRLTAPVLAAAMLAGCGAGANSASNGSTSANNTSVDTLGRYIENDITPTELKEADSDSSRVLDIYTNKDTVKLLVQTSAPTPETNNTYTLYSSTDGGKSWQSEDILSELNSQSIAQADFASDSELYFYYVSFSPDGTSQSDLAKYNTTDKQLTSLKGVGDIPENLSMIQNMGILSDGSLFLQWMDFSSSESEAGNAVMMGPSSMSTQTSVFDSASGSKKYNLALESVNGSTPFACSNDTLYLLTETKILSFDLSGGKEKNTVFSSKEISSEFLYNRFFVSDADNNLYVRDNSGFVRMNSGGNLNEVIMESSRYTFGNPINSAFPIVLNNDGAFYMVITNKEGVRLLRLDYDPESPIQTETTLSLYSLYDSPSLRAAISNFQTAHPEVEIDLQIGINTQPFDFLDESQKKQQEEDAVRSLNTSLLSGDGPDLLVLDGLPVASFAEKGILEDLSSLVDTSSIYSKIIEDAKTDGKLFVVPTRFSLPLFISDPDKAQNLNSLQSIADFALANPKPQPLNFAFGQETSIDAAGLPVRSHSELFDLLYLGSAGALMDKNEVNTDAVAEFLKSYQSISEYYDFNNPALSSGGVSVMVGSVAGSATDSFSAPGTWTLFPQQSLTGFQTVSHFAQAFFSFGSFGMGEPQSVSGNITGIPGLKQGGYLPQVQMGINASSKQKELAGEMISALLDSSVQNYSLNDGLPVTKAGLENHYQQSLETSNNENAPALDTLLNTMQYPIAENSVFRSLLEETALSYSKGEKSLEDAVSAVTKGMELYFAEQ